MDLSLNDHDKCRICLSPDTNTDFIQLKGSKAVMFTEVTGVELTIDGLKTESLICQNCFVEVERCGKLSSKERRSDGIYCEIQRQLEAIRRKANEPEQAAYEIETHDVQTNEPRATIRVKREPPVDFVLILPRPANDQSEGEDNDINRKWIKSVELTKFDAKWKCNSTLFQTFLTCKHCQLIVRHQGHLTRHLRTCNKINPARFECDICGGRSQMKWLMGWHMLKHSNERNFRCNECGFGFKSRRELTAHKKIHDKSISCSTCQKKFARNQHLKLHQMQHRHGIYAAAPEETYECNKCDKTFSTPMYLKMHKRVVHDENEVKCTVCHKIYKNRALMLQHIRTHTKVECSICSKLVSKKAMTTHVRSHSSPFECDLCNHSSSFKNNLKGHIERHLREKLVKDSKRDDFSDLELLKKLQLKYPSSAKPAEKKFQCIKCKKAFATQNILKQHKRQVHVEKLFECQLCKMAFKTKGHLLNHKVKVHAKMSFE